MGHLPPGPIESNSKLVGPCNAPSFFQQDKAVFLADLGQTHGSFDLCNLLAADQVIRDPPEEHTDDPFPELDRMAMQDADSGIDSFTNDRDDDRTSWCLQNPF